jgi:pyruvate,water dikinase
MAQAHLIAWLENLTVKDVPLVGGKNASLGEMIQKLKSKGILVPGGFATTSKAYWRFVEDNGLAEKISTLIKKYQKDEKKLPQVGKEIRGLFLRAKFPQDLEKALCESYRKLCRREKRNRLEVAVRSSATAEDLPEASFAGQQETYLNVSGEKQLLRACIRCLASLFTDRAIAYREKNGFDHLKVALSVGVQIMVRSDLGSAGVMFSLDTESGFPDVVVINGAWGLGENVVQGNITPDEYMVFQPLLEKKKKPILEKVLGTKKKKMIYAKGKGKTTKNIPTTTKERRSYVLNDQEILQLAKWATLIEHHYKKEMDMEWAKDGKTGKLYIVQARPETVASRREAADFISYELKGSGKRLVQGLAIGSAAATGRVRVLRSTHQMDQFKDGEILVTEKTDPDWVPVMKRAAAIVTELGGRTSHAAIVSRELGVPAVIGTGNATRVLKNGREVTVSCAEGDQGFVYEGKLKFEKIHLNLKEIPETKTRIMINLASPAASLRWWRLPCHGVGLARMEFIINNIIKIHPMALINFKKLKDKKAKKQIQELTLGYSDKIEYFVENLALGIAKIAVSQYPEPVIVRMSDFKTNEYADLIGGREFEPEEANPMLGFRGASRYYSEEYRDGFALECRAIRRVREEIGLENVVVMIPFCRTLEEADKVLAEMKKNGLERGKNNLQVYVMAEIPSNVELAAQFAQRFDGFSIGSNDLTQLVLGVDRDSEKLAYLFDERNDAVKGAIRRLIATAHAHGVKVGICGQAPSDYPEFAQFLVSEGIDSISLNPDSVIKTKRKIAEFEG